MFDETMPGRQLWNELMRIGQDEPAQGTPTNSMRRIAALLSLFFPDEAEQEFLLELLIGYLFNMTLALGVQQVELLLPSSVIEGRSRGLVDGHRALRVRSTKDDGHHAVA